MRMLLTLLLVSCNGAPGVIQAGGVDNGGSTAAICEPGATLCNAGTLLLCRNDGSGHTPISCELGCQAGACLSAACATGSTRCRDGLIREQCTDGQWITTLCESGCRDGACVVQTCVPGLDFCDAEGATVLRCAPDGSSADIVESCPLGCDGATATCDSAACVAGTLRCGAGEQPERCDEAGVGYVTEGPACAERCEDGACIVSACTPNKKRCGPNGVEACLPDGSAYAALKACEYGCLQGPDGQAVCASCYPGAYSCSAKNEIVYCADPFAGWQMDEACPAIETCQAGSCEDLVSLSGSNTLDSVRLLLMEAIADCFVHIQTTPKEQTGDEGICRAIDTTQLSGDIGHDELRDWFCKSEIGPGDFVDEAHYEAADDVLGCGTFDNEDLVVSTLNKKIHAGVSAEECIGFNRKNDEILVAPCSAIGK